MDWRGDVRNDGDSDKSDDSEISRSLRLRRSLDKLRRDVNDSDDEKNGDNLPKISHHSESESEDLRQQVKARVAKIRAELMSQSPDVASAFRDKERVSGPEEGSPADPKPARAMMLSKKIKERAMEKKRVAALSSRLDEMQSSAAQNDTQEEKEKYDRLPNVSSSKNRLSSKLNGKNAASIAAESGQDRSRLPKISPSRVENDDAVGARKKKKPLYMRMAEKANKQKDEEDKQRQSEYLRRKLERERNNPSKQAIMEHMARHDHLVQQRVRELQERRVQQMVEDAAAAAAPVGHGAAHLSPLKRNLNAHRMSAENEADDYRRFDDETSSKGSGSRNRKRGVPILAGGKVDSRDTDANSDAHSDASSRRPRFAGISKKGAGNKQQSKPKQPMPKSPYDPGVAARRAGIEAAFAAMDAAELDDITGGPGGLAGLNIASTPKNVNGTPSSVKGSAAQRQRRQSDKVAAMKGRPPSLHAHRGSPVALGLGLGGGGIEDTPMPVSVSVSGHSAQNTPSHRRSNAPNPPPAALMRGGLPSPGPGLAGPNGAAFFGGSPAKVRFGGDPNAANGGVSTARTNTSRSDASVGTKQTLPLSPRSNRSGPTWVDEVLRNDPQESNLVELYTEGFAMYMAEKGLIADEASIADDGDDDEFVKSMVGSIPPATPVAPGKYK